MSEDVTPVGTTETVPAGNGSETTPPSEVKLSREEYEALVAAQRAAAALPEPSPESANAALGKAVEAAVKDMFEVNEQAWAPRMVVKFKIALPSGQTALVKHLDTLDLLNHDLIEELDFFTRKLFPESIDLAGNPVEAQQKVEASIWEALRDVDKRRRFLEMTGRLMAAASVRPKIVHDGVAVVDEIDEDTGQPTGEKTTKFGYQMSMDEQLKHFNKPIALLPPNAVYSGYIDFADRMAFFQELNQPLAQIEPFREESSAVLQDLARGEGPGSTA